MKRFVFLALALIVFPLAAHAGKNETISVDINTSRGPKAIPLVRKGDGFVGPRGEYYSSFPSKKTLSAVYGTSSSKPAPIPVKPGGEIKVTVIAGGVNIHRNGRLITQVRTKLPDVRGWKLIRENTAIVVKSGTGREPGIVQLFEVRNGRLLEQVKATAIKDGKPAWAKNFAE